jgi:hypothetical protein
MQKGGKNCRLSCNCFYPGFSHDDVHVRNDDLCEDFEE